ncbi:MAG: ATP-dependent metallopeptidase FtsH/Yme1/Tma family protein, partial [Sphingomonadales bacterium]
MSEINNNKPKPGGFKFNPYWIYGVIFIVMLVLTFLPRNAGKSTNWTEVRQMILQGDVEKITIVNEQLAEIYLTREALKKDEHKGNTKKEDLLGSNQPNYYFEIEKGYFNNEIKDLKEEFKDKKIDTPIPPIAYESHSDFMGQLFQWLFFIGIFLIFWSILFRRVGGGGGGSGSNIFSI